VDEPQSAPSQAKTPASTLALRWAVAAVALVVAGALGWYGWAWAASPQSIRHPVKDHYHFRMQVIVDGLSINFADSKYQTPVGSDICTAAITKQPFHFHDNLDQFVHVHWAGMTGGLLMKNYGWNQVGGPMGLLGYNFESLLKFHAVPVHQGSLPAPAKGDHYYIYTGTDESFQLEIGTILFPSRCATSSRADRRSRTLGSTASFLRRQHTPMTPPSSSSMMWSATS